MKKLYLLNGHTAKNEKKNALTKKNSLVWLGIDDCYFLIMNTKAKIQSPYIHSIQQRKVQTLMIIINQALITDCNWICTITDDNW